MLILDSNHLHCFLRRRGLVESNNVRLEGGARDDASSSNSRDLLRLDVLVKPLFAAEALWRSGELSRNN